MNSVNRTRQSTPQATESSIRFAYFARNQRVGEDASACLSHIDLNLAQPESKRDHCDHLCGPSRDESDRTSAVEFDPFGSSIEETIAAIKRYRHSRLVVFELLPDGNCVLS
ncbi:MAG: hypothetical protein ACOYNZ_04215 [Rhodoferax sp.]